MSDSSCGRKHVAGFNQFAKLVRRGKALKVYLANDADVFFVTGVKNELKGNNKIVLDTSFNSAQLAEMAGVEVPTAVITEAEV